MKKIIEMSKKILSSAVLASFICVSVPCGEALSSPIQNLQKNLGKGTAVEGAKAPKKKSAYNVKKVKASKKTKSKSAKSRPGSGGGNLGDAAYESSSNAAPVAMASGASGLASKIVSSIRGLLNSTAFRGADVKGGKVACAKVVSTALKNAGVINRVILGVPDLVSEVKRKGFKEVKAPPFKAGDIVTWRTYDRNKDGKKDNDTHIGIVDSNGQAISNSSSRRMPRRHGVNYAPICRVLRKA
ncbi:MAG TPA: hypothetical protein PKL57_09690 [Candidatus Wallbacteria bacterium]|nr:hypothetical protein [Candidatus Wallbacteria bacterium]